MVRTLRVSTGCDQCKNRRKKCDERKPRCSDCHRLGFSCSWDGTSRRKQTAITYPVKFEPVAQQTQSTPAPAFIEKPAISTNVVPLNKPTTNILSTIDSSIHTLGNGLDSFTNQNQLFFTLKSSSDIQALVSLGAASEFHDLSFFVSIAFEYPWIRNALAAFSAYSTYKADPTCHKLKDIASELHRTAITNVRNKLSQTCSKADMLPLLTAVSFLGLFESFTKGDLNNAAMHLLAAARLSQQIAAGQTLETRALTVYRICVESWLYGLSSLSFFHPISESCIKTIDFSIFKPTFQSAGLPDTSTSKNSPFLLGNHEIYILLLKITCFLRSNPTSASRRAKVVEWSAITVALEAQLESYYEMYDDDIADECYTKYTLYLLSLRILLVEVEQIDEGTIEPAVCQLAQQALLIFDSHPNSRQNPSLALPLLVFLFAAHDLEAFSGFVAVFDEMKAHFDDGHSFRFKKVLTSLAQIRRRQKCPYPAISSSDFCPLNLSQDYVQSIDGEFLARMSHT